jgi:hypothetical protein
MGEMNPRLVFSDDGIIPRANLAFGLKILTMLQTRFLVAAWVKEQLQRASSNSQQVFLTGISRTDPHIPLVETCVSCGPAAGCRADYAKMSMPIVQRLRRNPW